MTQTEIRKADLLVFLVLLGWGLTTSLLSIYLNNLGISLANIGLIFGVGMIISGIVRIPMGTVVDKLGKKKFLLFGAIGFPIFAAGIALSTSIGHFIFLQLLIGFFSAVFWIAFGAYFFDIMSRGREGVQLGARNTVIYATAAFAPILAGIIAGNFGFTVLFFIAAFIGVAGIAAAVTIKEKSRSIAQIRFKDIREEYKDIFKIRGYKTILFGISVVSLIMALWLIFLPIWLQDQGLGLEAIGTILTVNLLIGAILQVPLGKLIDKYPARMIIVPGFFFMWLGGILFFTFQNFFSFIVNRAFFGLANDAAHWPHVGMLAKITPKKEHGVAVAGISAAARFAHGGAALGGGILAATYGIEALLFGSAFLALATGLILTYSKTLMRKGKLFYKKHHMAMEGYRNHHK